MIKSINTHCRGNLQSICLNGENISVNQYNLDRIICLIDIDKDRKRAKARVAIIFVRKHFFFDQHVLTDLNITDQSNKSTSSRILTAKTNTELWPANCYKVNLAISSISLKLTGSQRTQIKWRSERSEQTVCSYLCHFRCE